MQVARLRGIGLDLVSQPVHQLLQQLPVAAAATAPDVHQQAFGADHVAGVGDQDLQQPRLELGEPQRRRLADAQRQALEVEAERPGGHRPARSMPARRSSALMRASSVRGLNGLVR